MDVAVALGLAVFVPVPVALALKLAVDVTLGLSVAVTVGLGAINVSIGSTAKSAGKGFAGSKGWGSLWTSSVSVSAFEGALTVEPGYWPETVSP